MVQNRENIQTDDQEEIDLGELLLYFKKKLVLIIAVFVIGMVGAGLFTRFLITPKYTATAKLYVVSASGKSVVNLDDLRLGTTLSTDYKELLMARPIFTEIIEELGLEYTYRQLKSMVSIEGVGDTRILAITVVSTKPKEAMDIANALTDKAITYLPKLMGITPPNISEDAIEPAMPSSPNLAKNAMLGGILAAIVLMGILTVLFLKDDTVKTSEDVEKLIGVVPLTVIPENSDQSRKVRRRKER
ncbi:MAG: Wzz/FepE/Etk N-terminal domain-containing protein [Lachnospiraceae bacterium]|nr:Wzz/FepE/Etk N-terminal domain-containing protein [Lachnospiraceae bacterium]